MDYTNIFNWEEVGVIGTGNFGTAVANLLAENQKVLLYTRRKEVRDSIAETRENRGQKLHVGVETIGSPSELCKRCKLIFPIIPSDYFRKTIVEFSPFLEPEHILIHGTKGLDVVGGRNKWMNQDNGGETLERSKIRTMAEVIAEESVVARVGCLSGPNLSREIADLKPAAAVVASKYQEVIEAGKKALMSSRFRIYGSEEILGVEFAGTLKNVVAIACGAISGLELGENTKALLITRGLAEMSRLGHALGASLKAFFGLAGVGDLIATCSSPLSRNFQVGYRLAKGETMVQIQENRSQVAEGVFTVKVAKSLAKEYSVNVPVVEALHEMLFEEVPIQAAISRLMERPFVPDVDFI